MDVKTLLARAAAQREHWADLGNGKRLRFLRPVEVEMPALLNGVTVEHVIGCANGWEGFTEADLLGAAVGASDPLPFHVDLWSAVVRDNAAYVAAVSQAIADAVTEYLKRKAGTEKK